jgi:hypothetical protein
MKSSPIRLKQKLSPKAAAAKKIRDKKAAMSEDGKRKKREAQVLRRKKTSTFLKGKDYDHYTGSFVSSSKNRAGMNPDKRGTKNE